MYQASRDGFSSANFHFKCNGILDTLIVIQSNSSYIFGGYTEANWDGYGYKSDANAFLFSLINGYNTSVKMPIIPQYASGALFARSDYGPTFGSCFDLSISADGSHGSSNSGCTPFPAYTYQLPSFIKSGSLASQIFLGGSLYFIPIEIEVFQKIVPITTTTTSTTTTSTTTTTTG